MKFIIPMLLITAAQCHASWFSHNDDYQDRWQQSQQQLEHQRQLTGDWQIAAGALAVGAVILFTVGTALGSKIRRDARRKEADHE